MKLLKWVIPVVIIGFVLFCGVQYASVMNYKPDVYREYTSIDDIEKSVAFEFTVPEMVKNNINKDITIELFGGELVKIECSDIKFRVAPKAADWADVMGIEYPSEVSEYYEVENNKIKSLRCRYGYDDNTSVYNWYTDDLMYGVIVNESVKLSDILDDLDISEEDIYELSLDGKRVQENNEIEFKSYTTKDGKLNILIPETNTRLDDVISGKSIIFNMCNKMIMLITSDLEKTEMDNYEYKEFNDYRLYILVDNPFEEGTDAYEDFNKIKDNIDRTINSVIIAE